MGKAKERGNEEKTGVDPRKRSGGIRRSCCGAGRAIINLCLPVPLTDVLDYHKRTMFIYVSIMQ